MRELYCHPSNVSRETLEGWNEQHRAARAELAEAKDCINEQLYTIRQLEWLTSEQSREIAALRIEVAAWKALAVQKGYYVERLRLQRVALVALVFLLGSVIGLMWLG